MNDSITLPRKLAEELLAELYYQRRTGSWSDNADKLMGKLESELAKQNNEGAEITQIIKYDNHK